MSGRAAPVVSVCMPTHNRADELAKRVEEMRAQTFEDFEFVIVDDGSTDDTPSVAGSAQEAEDRVRYVRLDPAARMPGVLERCMQEARTDYVAIFHDHDSYDPRTIEELRRALDDQPDALFSFCGITATTSAGHESFVEPPGFGRRGEIVDSFIQTGACRVCASATMVRRELLPDPAFRPELGLFADVGLWCELSVRGPSAYVPESLVTVVGWERPEGLAKGNLETLGKLTDLRREYATRIAGSEEERRALDRHIVRHSTQERRRFLLRLVKQALRGGEIPPAALREVPAPVHGTVRLATRLRVTA
jgi:glycosyltransferase involved in cell wall biosynthesis